MSDTRTYFAQVTDGVVTDVRVVTQEFMDENPERYTGTWVETFPNRAGKQYAGIGMEYLPETQDFRVQQPYPSWTWTNKVWNPPTPIPTDNGTYRWDEEELEWVAI